MRPEAHSINYVLKMNSTSFFIPPFQRAYAWGRPEIERYFSDVIRIINSELDTEQKDKLEHFFGTLVIRNEESGFSTKSIVVDGQQRLTTTLLFLIALRDLQEDENIKNFIRDNYLTNSSSSFQDKIKLKQVTKDWDAYRALVNGTEGRNSIIKNGYEAFKGLISDTQKRRPEIKIEHYIKALDRMNVAIIFLDERPYKGEDPQIIFETLNSLGKPLSLSDLVRNYVLFNMKSEEQSDIYENIWYPKIESVLKEFVSDFFRDFLQYKMARSIRVVGDNNTKEIYQIFKDFVDANYKKNHVEFVEDIVSFVPFYKWIIYEEHTDIISEDKNNDSEIKELLRNIFHDIKTEAFKPFVAGLLFFHQKANNNYCDSMLISDLKVIRTYLIRRRISKLTQGENKGIVLLCEKSILSSIVEGKKSVLDILSNLFYKLRFPNDDEITFVLSNINFYEEVRQYGKFILGKIEENNSKVSVDFRDSKITIEHIMPQTLTNPWENELGNNYEEVHKKYIHNIGNLILTEFNSEIGNKPFSEKKQKLAESSLHYRLDILDCPVWNEDSILEHRNKIISDFLETFSLPEEYKNKSNWNTAENIDIHEIKEFSPLDEDSKEYAEGNKPKAIRCFNKTIKVITWQDVQLAFLNEIHNSEDYDFQFIFDNQMEIFGRENAIITWNLFKEMIENNREYSTKYKTLDGVLWNKKSKINGETLFIHINISARACMRRIANIMEKFCIKNEDVIIELK